MDSLILKHHNVFQNTERNFKSLKSLNKRIKAPIFLDEVLAIEIM